MRTQHRLRRIEEMTKNASTSERDKDNEREEDRSKTQEKGVGQDSNSKKQIFAGREAKG